MSASFLPFSTRLFSRKSGSTSGKTPRQCDISPQPAAVASTDRQKGARGALNQLGSSPEGYSHSKHSSSLRSARTTDSFLPFGRSAVKENVIQSSQQAFQQQPLGNVETQSPRSARSAPNTYSSTANNRKSPKGRRAVPFVTEVDRHHDGIHMDLYNTNSLENQHVRGGTKHMAFDNRPARSDSFNRQNRGSAWRSPSPRSREIKHMAELVESDLDGPLDPVEVLEAFFNEETSSQWLELSKVVTLVAPPQCQPFPVDPSRSPLHSAILPKSSNSSQAYPSASPTSSFTTDSSNASRYPFFIKRLRRTTSHNSSYRESNPAATKGATETQGCAPGIPIHQRPLPPTPLERGDSLRNRLFHGRRQAAEESRLPLSIAEEQIDQLQSWHDRRHIGSGGLEGFDQELPSLHRQSVLMAHIISPQERARMVPPRRASLSSASVSSGDESTSSGVELTSLAFQPLPSSPFRGTFTSHKSLNPPPRPRPQILAPEGISLICQSTPMSPHIYSSSAPALSTYPNQFHVQ